jgi:hypothetical protein
MFGWVQYTPYYILTVNIPDILFCGPVQVIFFTSLANFEKLPTCIKTTWWCNG